MASINNDLQHLESKTTLTLAYSNTLSGFRGPISAKVALRDHPEAFMVLLEEMTRALQNENNKQKQMRLEL
jgi:hypothetical protein